MKGKESTPHIGIFGRRNYGKSSLVNFLTGQQVAIVSNTPGTTTDPVKKSMEISGIGPVVWIDTAGIDDEGSVGRLRIEKSLQILEQTDLALILFTHNKFEAEEVSLVDACVKKAIPFLLIYSMTDVSLPDKELIDRIEADYDTKVFLLSVHNEQLREPLILAISQLIPESSYRHQSLLGDVVRRDDVVVLVAPIDSSAPEGRLILPQVQVLRDLLDLHAKAFVCQPDELPQTLSSLSLPPSLVVTDSQVFKTVSQIVPESVPLTSFSVILARSKGLFNHFVEGTRYIDSLREGDKVLILESCTHNVSCEDIGRVKIPRLLQKYTGHSLQCEVVGGLSPLVRPLTNYALVIQCGGCVVTPRQLRARIEPAIEAGVPVSNYGLAIAYMNGIFHRSVAVFNK